MAVVAKRIGKAEWFKRALLAMCEASSSEVHVANPEDKAAARALEREGKIVVRRTNDRCGGLIEWWIKLAPASTEGASDAR